MGVWCSLRFKMPGAAAVLAVAGLLLSGAFYDVPGVGPQAPRLEDGPHSGIVHALDAGRGEPAGEAVSRTLRAVAEAHDVPVGEPETCPSLAHAVALHADRLGAPAPTVPVTVPSALDEALACLLHAVHQSNLALDRTFDGLTNTELMTLFEAAIEERPLSPALYALLEGRDHAHNLAAAIHAAEAVDQAVLLLEGLQASATPLPEVDLEPILRFTPQGSTVYERNYALIVDMDGDDTYDNHAGGVFVAAGSGIWEVEEGSGYFGTDVLGQNIVVGGNVQDSDAVISSSLVLDLAGDDQYGVKHPPILKDASEGCTEEDLIRMVVTAGAGAIGTGMLFDLGGNDTFIGRSASQGAGHLLGVGVLYSGGGDDTFEAIRLAQGSGLFGGIGLLINDEGQNTYQAQSPPGGAWNGDLLFCDTDARYVQGSGFTSRPGHSVPSVGILADLGGDTSYMSDRKAHGFGQGPGLALLYDRTGDDSYHALELAQGAAQGRNADTHPQSPWGGGLAVLFDREGDDDYTLLGGDHGHRGQGYSLGQPGDEPLPDPQGAIGWAMARNEAIGLHLDAGGSDSYQGPDGRGDDVVHMDGVVGLFINHEQDEGTP